MQITEQVSFEMPLVFHRHYPKRAHVFSRIQFFIKPLSWRHLELSLTAAYLELRADLDILDLFDNFSMTVLLTDDDVLDGDLIPKKAYEQHFVRVLIPTTVLAEGDYPSVFFAIRTFNHKKAYSKISNLGNALYKDPRYRCDPDITWPHDLVSRVRRTKTPTTAIAEDSPAGPTDAGQPDVAYPRSPSPPSEPQLTSVSLVSLGILIIVILLLFAAAGVWDIYRDAKRDFEGGSGHTAEDVEMVVEAYADD